MKNISKLEYAQRVVDSFREFRQMTPRKKHVKFFFPIPHWNLLY